MNMPLSIRSDSFIECFLLLLDLVMQDQVAMMRYAPSRICQRNVVNRVVDFGIDMVIQVVYVVWHLSQDFDDVLPVRPVDRMDRMSFEVWTHCVRVRVQARGVHGRIPAHQWMQSGHVCLPTVRMMFEVMLMDLFLQRQRTQLVPRATHSCQRVHALPVGRDAVDMRLLPGMNVQHFLHFLWLRVHVLVHVVLPDGGGTVHIEPPVT